MATITLLSAKGSPGVTTTVVGLTLAWSQAVPGRSALALDADPAGGDTAAGVLRGSVPPAAGVLALATSRGVPAIEALDRASVHLREDASARLVTGVPDSARGAALPLAWDVVAGAREELDAHCVDLIVDAGRVDLSRSVPPWLSTSDAAVLLVHPTLPAVTAAHRLASSWTAPGAPTAQVPLRLLVVSLSSPYGPGEVAEAVGIRLLGVLPHEPQHARVHSEGAPPGRGFARSGYLLGIQGLAADLAGIVGHSPQASPRGASERRAARKGGRTVLEGGR